MSPLSSGEAHGAARAAGARPGLRSSTIGRGGSPSGHPGKVLRIDPGDGATGVFRDSTVVVTLTHAADRGSVTDDALVVTEGCEVVEARVVLSPDGRVLVWTGTRLLRPGVVHEVSCRGVRDIRGRDLAPLRTRFVPCDLTWAELIS